MALALVACFFSANPTVIIIDSREIIKTNSNFRFANLDYDATHFALGKSLLPHFETNDTAITQGFVGSDENGYTTTMGFESSNLTATIISDFLKASELTLWTDVDCIYNADPKLYLNAKPILSIDYETALLAGSAGLKLIYPEMIKIAQKNNIILNFRNGLSTNDIYTQINNKSIQKSAFIIPIKSREIITEGNLSFLDMIQKYHLDNVESISTFNNNSSVIFDRNRRDNSFLADIISSEITIIYIINSNKSLFMTQLIDNYSVLIDNGVVRIQSSNDLRILKLYVLTDNRIDLEDFINNLCNYI
jgi:aspartate kinase